MFSWALYSTRTSDQTPMSTGNYIGIGGAILDFGMTLLVLTQAFISGGAKTNHRSLGIVPMRAA